MRDPQQLGWYLGILRERDKQIGSGSLPLSDLYDAYVPGTDVPLYGASSNNPPQGSANGSARHT